MLQLIILCLGVLQLNAKLMHQDLKLSSIQGS
jgi:hypothetical protein